MAKIIDLTNQRFGTLTAKYYLKKGNRSYWHCVCDCGNEIDIEGSNLRGGKTKSCGCQRAASIGKAVTKNLIGKKFSMLTVLEKTDKRQCGAIIWKCQCDCGNICYVPTGNLTSGHTQSCGCLLHKSSNNIVDLHIGDKIGKLTVLNQEPSVNNKTVWKCRCDCGREIKVFGWELTAERKISCGCINQSKGEFKIAQILLSHNVPFETQKTFDGCCSPLGAKLKFDFYVNNSYLIEFDGQQHFEATSGWNDEENLAKVQLYDKIKNDWCKENSIPLIRISYKDYKNITPQMLGIGG